MDNPKHKLHKFLLLILVGRLLNYTLLENSIFQNFGNIYDDALYGIRLDKVSHTCHIF